MSLRFVGRQLLQTRPVAALSGSRRVSLSFSIRINPKNEVHAAEGAVLFEDGAGLLTVRLFGRETLEVAWQSEGGASSERFELTPGQDHEVATVWDGGIQSYYLDGLSTKVVGTSGPLGRPEFATLGDVPYRLGSDDEGVDVVLGGLTLWQGYALSAREARDLGQGVALAGEVAAGQIALRWTLAGEVGREARAGDPGLSDNASGSHDLVPARGTAPTYRPLLSRAGGASIGSLQVGPSGQSILMTFLDGSGALTPVQSLLSADDVQFISVSGTPAGPNFTLSYSGQATGPIPIFGGPPSTSAVFQGVVTPGSWDLAVAWVRQGGIPAGYISGVVNTTQSLWVVYDGDTVLQSFTIDQTQPPAGLTDGQGTWFPLGTFSFTSTTLRVVVSAPTQAGAIVNVDGIRFVQHGDANAADVKYIDDAYGGSGSCTFNGAWRSFPFGGPFDSTASVATPSGTTPTRSVDPAVVQSALQALSNVPAGSISASTTNIGNVLVRFTGPLGGLALPTLVASDPAVAVHHDGTNGSVVGGVLPTISINGGSPVPLKTVYWGIDGNYQPWVDYILPQSAAAVRYFQANTVNFSAPGYGVWTLPVPGASAINDLVPGSLGSTAISTNPSAVATWPFEGLPAGTYSIATTYTPAAGNAKAALFSVTDDGGATLGTLTIDQTQAPADFQDRGVRWKTIGSFTLNGFASSLNVALTFGGPGGTLTADTLRLARTSPDVSVKILPTDKVTFSAVNGFVATNAGAVPAQVNAPVKNVVGGSTFPPFAATPKTMKVGYNFLGDSYFNGVMPFANLASRINLFGPTHDENFVTTSISSQTATIDVTDSLTDSGGYQRNQPNMPAGLYTIQWDGPDDLALGARFTSTATEVVSQRVITGTTNNQRVYNVQDPFFYAPQVTMVVTSGGAMNADGTYPLALKNLRIYPPGVSVTNPGRFHPATLAQLKGINCLRFLDPLGTNNSNIVNYSDFPLPSWLSALNTVPGPPAVPIASVVGYTGPDVYFDPSHFAIFHVTTKQPHGLGDGWPVVLSGPIGVAHYDSGGSLDLSNFLVEVCRVISPTEFLVNAYSAVPSLMTNTLTPIGCYAYKGPGSGNYSGNIAFLDCIAMCNAVGCDLWLNIPHLATDACVTAMAQAVAAGLNPGLKVHVEYSNECWNFTFIQFSHCYGMSRVLGGTNQDYSYYFTLRTGQIHALFFNAFQAAGRPTSDVRRVMGTQGGYAPGSTANICAHAVAFGLQFDELATAPYFHNDYAQTSQPRMEPVIAGLTSDQLLDLMEMHIEYGNYDLEFATQHLQVLAANGYHNVQVVHYEGGPETLIPNGSPNSANANARNHAVHRHTRFYGIMLRFLQKQQDAGVTLFNQFKHSGDQSLSSGQPAPYQYDPKMWTTYTGWNQAPGTGDPVADAANNATPEYLPMVKSQVGGAMTRWAQLTATPPTHPNRYVVLKGHGQSAHGQPAH